MSGRVVVTGATGFLGTALVDALRAEGREVTALVRRTSTADAVVHLQRAGARLAVADVADPAAPLDRIVGGADLVVHSAGLIGYRRRLHGAMWRTNVLGTRRVGAACLRAGIGRLVHVSSIAAVGVADGPVPLDEDARWNAGSLRAPYFDTKHAAEREIDPLIARGLDAVIVAPGAIYGPSPVGSNSSRVLLQVARGRVPFAPEGGVNVVPLETVVRGTLAAARHGPPGRRWILGGENLTTRDLIVRIGRRVGRELDPPRFPTALAPALRAAMAAAEPFVPASASFTPDLVAAFGRWLWYDTGRAARELDVVASDFDACLAETVSALRRAGRLY